MRTQHVATIICQAENESLVHFLLHCPAYLPERLKALELQQPYEENLEHIIGTFLFSERNIENNKDILWNMWKIREGRMKTT